jgi:predicted MFS family arabinose efflux permease
MSQEHQGHGEKGYRAYVLGALLVVYTFNFIDRILIGIVQEPIRREFDLTDGQLGLLGGLAFALLYTLLGIPIARFAERSNRISIIAIGFGLWSAMTAACGFAVSFVQLVAARVGVGIGEAACSPPAHSVISDYFPAGRRASALSIYALGIPIGTMLAAIGGGWLAQNLDWRMAFWILGAPGVVLALLFKLTVREPPRVGAQEQAPSFSQTLSTLARKPAFWHATLGASWMAFVGYGIAQFLPAHFIRSFGLSLFQASVLFGLVAGISTTAGTFLGGALGDRLSAKRPHALFWLPALGLAVALPLYLAAFSQTSLALGLAPLFAAVVFHYLYLGPSFAVIQGLSAPRMRATAAAIMLFAVNLIGYGGGPAFVGWAADHFAAAQLSHQGLLLADCAGVEGGACAAARAHGLRLALFSVACVMPLPALHFLLAARTWLRDRVG